MKRPLLLILIIISSAIISARASEMTLDYQQIQKLDKDRLVKLLTVLDDGRMVMVSENPDAGDVRLIFTSTAGKSRSRLSIPAKNVEYIAVSPDGRNVVAYSQDRYSFFFHNTRMRKNTWSVFSSHQGADPGFALFGGRKSRMFFKGSEVFAWGYYYDRAGDYLKEGLARIHYDRIGPEAFEELMDHHAMEALAKKYFPNYKDVSYGDVNGDYIILVITAENRGCLVGYNIASKEDFLIDNFESFMGCSLSRKGGMTAYVTKPLDSAFSGVLFFYDLELKRPVKAVHGKYYNPVISPDGSLVAVGQYVELAGKVISPAIRVYPTHDGRSEIYAVDIPVYQKINEWSFSGNGCLNLISRDSLFRKRIKKID